MRPRIAQGHGHATALPPNYASAGVQAQTDLGKAQQAPAVAALPNAADAPPLVAAPPPSTDAPVETVTDAGEVVTVSAPQPTPYVSAIPADTVVPVPGVPAQPVVRNPGQITEAAAFAHPSVKKYIADLEAWADEEIAKVKADAAATIAKVTGLIHGAGTNDIHAANDIANVNALSPTAPAKVAS